MASEISWSFECLAPVRDLWMYLNADLFAQFQVQHACPCLRRRPRQVLQRSHAGKVHVTHQFDFGGGALALQPATENRQTTSSSIVCLSVYTASPYVREVTHSFVAISGVQSVLLENGR